MKNIQFILSITILIASGQILFSQSISTESITSEEVTSDISTMDREKTAEMNLNQTDKPVQVVNRQLKASNSYNFEDFLNKFADNNIEAYPFPDQLLGKSKEALNVQYV